MRLITVSRLGMGCCYSQGARLREKKEEALAPFT